ncbi:NAD(P)H-dependent oxidoreductase [Candidatus Saccharibacteria bacterium]|nr:NAD(P)H-dependent oxidoreductase [Candidatus Saccharibacteria bacterium]
MKIVVVSGSGRTDSQSVKVSNWIATELSTQGVNASVIELAREDYLPMLHTEVWGDVMGEPAQKLQAKLADADGYVIVTPEWAGMPAPALKNFFLYVGKSMADKPALLVGVSSTMGGQYPTAELRTTSHKNTRIVYIPEQLIVRHAEDVMNSNEPATDSKDDTYIQARARYDLGVLLAYAETMQPLRGHKAIDYDTYPNGM